MKTPFANDPFALVWQAFTNLYPGIEIECWIEPQIRTTEDGTPVYGLTDFGEDGSIAVFVTPTITLIDAVEIFAHELAHAAVGVSEDHGEKWQAAFDAIFREYNRIGDELFGRADNA